MRTVQFPWLDRLALVPMELVSAMKYFLLYLAVVVLLSLALGKAVVANLGFFGVPVLGALLIGTAGVPLLLPWLPFRSFTLKGWTLGTLWAVGVSAWAGVGYVQFISNLLFLPVLSAGYALAFTGSTTFTSQSGVNKEIRLFARPMAVAGILGLAVMLANWAI